MGSVNFLLSCYDSLMMKTFSWDNVYYYYHFLEVQLLLTEKDTQMKSCKLFSLADKSQAKKPDPGIAKRGCSEEVGEETGYIGVFATKLGSLKDKSYC